MSNKNFNFIQSSEADNLEVNVYLNTIIDETVNYYYNYFFMQNN